MHKMNRDREIDGYHLASPMKSGRRLKERRKIIDPEKHSIMAKSTRETGNERQKKGSDKKVSWDTGWKKNRARKGMSLK